MNLEVTGKLHEIFPIKQISETFSTREFVLEISEPGASGMVYTNYPAFQLVNQGCGLIDQFQVGENITVNFNLRGRRWEKDGNVRYITNLNAWRVSRTVAADQGMPSNPVAQPSNFNNPATPSAGSSSNTGTMNSDDANKEADDLPF